MFASVAFTILALNVASLAIAHAAFLVVYRFFRWYGFAFPDEYYIALF